MKQAILHQEEYSQYDKWGFPIPTPQNVGHLSYNCKVAAPKDQRAPFLIFLIFLLFPCALTQLIVNHKIENWRKLETYNFMKRYFFPFSTFNSSNILFRQKDSSFNGRKTSQVEKKSCFSVFSYTSTFFVWEKRREPHLLIELNEEWTVFRTLNFVLFIIFVSLILVSWSRSSSLGQ